MSAFAVDPTNPAILYAGNSESGLFRSSDGGGTWTVLNSVIAVQSLALNPRDPRMVYAGTSGSTTNPGVGEVYRTVDGGATWTVLDTKLTAVFQLPNNPDFRSSPIGWRSR